MEAKILTTRPARDQLILHSVKAVFLKSEENRCYFWVVLYELVISTLFY